jgi:hypothetical protein
MDSTDDLAAIGVSPHRGRGWRILSGLLLVGTVTFAAAYYLPLYRAHATISHEYRTLSKLSTTQRKQLADTIESLNQVSTERDQLRDAAQLRQKSIDVLTPHAESLEHDLQAPLKKYLTKGKFQMERRHERLRVALFSPLLAAGAAGAAGDWSDAGKKALCELAIALKTADVSIVAQGLGVAAQAKTAPAWKLAAARAGSAAQLLSESCGIESARIKVQVDSLTPNPEGAAVILEITPKS